MADSDKTTLAVAVAGIAATALVGVAATAGAWLSARDDRATQRAIAHEERRYDRRVAAYLDAMDFVAAQKESLEEFLNPVAVRLGLARKIPYERRPSSRLTSRLRAFGSPEALEAFQRAQNISREIPIPFVARANDHSLNPRSGYIVDLKGHPDIVLPGAHEKFIAYVKRFEDTVHDEVG
jgi:hypothetical protein